LSNSSDGNNEGTLWLANLFWCKFFGDLLPAGQPEHKNVGGRGDHTRVFIADTRRGAQFSSGGKNLIRRAGMTSDF